MSFIFIFGLLSIGKHRLISTKNADFPQVFQPEADRGSTEKLCKHSPSERKQSSRAGRWYTAQSLFLRFHSTKKIRCTVSFSSCQMALRGGIRLHFFTQLTLSSAVKKLVTFLDLIGQLPFSDFAPDNCYRVGCGCRIHQSETRS